MQINKYDIFKFAWFAQYTQTEEASIFLCVCLDEIGAFFKMSKNKNRNRNKVVGLVK